MAVGSSGILYHCNGFKESYPVLLGRKAGLLWLSLNFRDVFCFIFIFLKNHLATLFVPFEKKNQDKAQDVLISCPCDLNIVQ